MKALTIYKHYEDEILNETEVPLKTCENCIGGLFQGLKSFRFKLIAVDVQPCMSPLLTNLVTSPLFGGENNTNHLR